MAYGPSKQLLKQEVQYLHKDKDDHNPLEGEALAVLDKVFEEAQILLHNLQFIADVPETYLQVERRLQADVDPVARLILLGDVR